MGKVDSPKQPLEPLIKQHLSYVYTICFTWLKNQADAEDATQQTFIKVWRSFSRFDQNKEFKPWVATIAKHTCLDMLKKKRADIDPALLTELADEAPLPDALTELALAQQTVAAAVQTLPGRDQTLLNMHYQQGLTLASIATKLRLSVNTVKSQHRRAIAALRKKLS